MSNPDPEKDYYSILGATEATSQEEMDRLYKRLAIRHHPDRGGDADEMKMINEAYGVLGNKAMRRVYDEERRPGPRPLSTTVSPLSWSAPLLEDNTTGRLVGATFYLMAGLMFLFLLRIYYVRFMWPLFVFAAFLLVIGVRKIHAALVDARERLASSHPMRHYVLGQEIAFWLIVSVSVCGICLIWSAI